MEHAALADCEVDRQVQIIHQQTRPGTPPTPMLWIRLGRYDPETMRLLPIKARTY